MFSTRTIAAIGAFSMITAIATTGRAQPRHHAKDADPDADTDTDTDTDTPRPKTKAKSKAKAKAKNVDPDADAEPDTDAPRSKSRSRTKAKAKAKSRGGDADSDADAEAEAQRERDREREREHEQEAERERENERERAREKEQAAADTDAAKDTTKDKLAATAAEATANNGAGGGEAYQAGTLGVSIPITVIGAAGGGAAGGEPVPTVDIVYFLDDKAALDLIVGVNVHRKHAAAPATGAMAGGGSDTTLIGAAAGLGYRMYSSKNGLRAFLEPQAVVSVPDTSNTDTLTINVGGLFGVERNLTPWFSISGAVGATVNLASTFKDIQLATAANLAANLYWR